MGGALEALVRNVYKNSIKTTNNSRIYTKRYADSVHKLTFKFLHVVRKLAFKPFKGLHIEFILRLATTDTPSFMKLAITNFREF